MSRITKDAAAAAAKKLTEPKSKKLYDLKVDLAKTVAEMYTHQHIPIGVLKFDEQFPEWLQALTHVYLQGNGFNNYGVPIFSHKVSLIESPKNGSYFYPNELQAKELTKKTHEIDSLKAEIDSLKVKVAAMLYEMRTLKKVKEQFPEAIQFLPKESPTGDLLPVVNINSIRESLKA